MAAASLQSVLGHAGLSRPTDCDKAVSGIQKVTATARTSTPVSSQIPVGLKVPFVPSRPIFLLKSPNVIPFRFLAQRANPQAPPRFYSLASTSILPLHIQRPLSPHFSTLRSPPKIPTHSSVARQHTDSTKHASRKSIQAFSSSRDQLLLLLMTLGVLSCSLLVFLALIKAPRRSAGVGSQATPR